MIKLLTEMINFPLACFAKNIFETEEARSWGRPGNIDPVAELLMEVLQGDEGSNVSLKQSNLQEQLPLHDVTRPELRAYFKQMLNTYCVSHNFQDWSVTGIETVVGRQLYRWKKREKPQTQRRHAVPHAYSGGELALPHTAWHIPYPGF